MSHTPDPVDQSVLDDLRERLRRTRWVPSVEIEGRNLGVDQAYLRDLVDDWAERYDWRTHEQRLLALPWAVTGGERPLRSIHQRAAEDAPAVVLLHGWPDSFLRYDRVLPRLGDLNVVVPCLPGFPYAAGTAGAGVPEMADLVIAAMAELGYDRYVVSGGDIGSSLAELIAHRHPDRVAALHLTDVPYTHLFTVDRSSLSDPERRYLEAGEQWQFTDGAYALEQSTRPNTLAVGLGDSPAGLAAWIVEKLRDWSDSDGDVETVFPREDLLTWLTLSWVTSSIGTSFASYADEGEPVGESIATPTVVTIFPKDLVTAPREFGERFFNLVEWTERPTGGHFGAWEDPAAFEAGVRAAVEAGVKAQSRS
ncbi:alpha/beta fold hydrolase [Agromyces sp. CFH 90414]|uniref:Alpha/beta fold hydrolase n=1 Tax=Agromyces agglutinans TaxID=2662258 RepID=A0A6I2F400_9MICO|nr:epoxide hydrolase family protein [Agromyces agglutinans]MRG60205.1 alpha/beta fold hydrolase [Agromyces agglutinans]